jgi:hypothetical protein
MQREQMKNGKAFTLAGARLEARGSGALWWAEAGMLVVSDLHLGKSERIARRGGAMLPPYETRDTLSRLEAEIAQLSPARVVCLGDSFDDDAACTGLAEEAVQWLKRLMQGRGWTWIEGNHDPAPPGLGGESLGELAESPLLLRHIARPGAAGPGRGEVSGHYHPKATLRAMGRQISRPCFLYDSRRVILPAFGTYTGGLRANTPELCDLMRPEALAILTGSAPVAIPMPGRAA